VDYAGKRGLGFESLGFSEPETDGSGRLGNNRRANREQEGFAARVKYEGREK